MSHEESVENTEYDFSLPKAAAWNDRPALDDSLEWEEYIEALYEFITHEDTNPPLTISIDGKWGVGKTSFMHQLEHKLRRDGHFTVNFNPWRHQDADPLWGAFMQSFLQQLIGSLSFRDRMRGRARLYLRGLRSDWARLLRPLTILAATMGVLVVVVVTPWLFGPVVAVAVLGLIGVEVAPTDFIALGTGGIGSLVGGAIWLVIVWNWSERHVVDPVHAELQRYLVLPRYEDHVSFIENFHEDLSIALDAYTGPYDRRVFVFIDDLDRCDIPEAATLMESINLMLSDDHRLVFLIGMDREKVSAGIAAKYNEVRKVLTAERGEQAVGSGVDFGENFIDKFIQVPFAIPRPNSFSGFGAQPAVNEVRERIAATPPRSPRDNPPSLTRTNLAAEIELSPETQDTIVELAARTLEHNPRRFKKFVNMFRLYSLIAHRTNVLTTGTETELLLSETREKATGNKMGDTQPKVTVNQLAKFVTIRLRWKRLVDSLYSDGTLLARLSVIALRRRYWREILVELNRRVHEDDADIDANAVPNAKEWQTINEQLADYEIQDVSPHRQTSQLPKYLGSKKELDALLLLLREEVVSKNRPSTEAAVEAESEEVPLDSIKEVSLSDPPAEVADAEDGRSSEGIAKRIVEYIGVNHFLKPQGEGNSGSGGVNEVMETLNERFAGIVNDREGFERATDINSEASLLRIDSKKLLRIAEAENFPERTPADRAFDLFDEGYAAHDEGEYKRAREKYLEALELFREVGYGYDESLTLHNIGATWEEEGNPELALSLYEDATDAAIWADYPDRQAWGLAGQGNIHFDREDYDQALEFYREASLVASANELSDIKVEALGLQGDVHKAQGDNEQALQRYEQAFSVAETNFNYEGMVRSLRWLGELHEQQEAWQDALERYEQAETIAREEFLEEALVDALQSQGLMREKLDAYDEALELYEKGYDVAMTNFDHQGAVNSLGLQGGVYEQREAYDEALAYYKEAEEIASANDLQESLMKSLHWQGLTKKELEAFDEAIERYERAYSIAADNEDYEAIISNLGYQGAVYEALENYKEAMAVYEEAEQIAADNNLQKKVVDVLHWQGFLQEELEAFDEALHRYGHAYTVASTNDDFDGAIDSLSFEGDIYEKREAYDEALERYEEAQAIAAVNEKHEKEVYMLQSQSLVYEKREAYDKALAHYEKATDLARVYDLSTLVAESLIWQGRIYETLEAYDLGVERYGEALAVAKEHQLRNAIAEALFGKAYIYELWREYERSHELFEQALKQYKAVDDDTGIAYTHSNLGYIMAEFGEFDAARKHYDQSLVIQPDQAQTLLISGDLYTDTGDYDRAGSEYAESKKLFEEDGDWEGLADLYLATGKMAGKQSDLELARTSYADSLSASWEDLRQSPTLNPAGRDLVCESSMLDEALEDRAYEKARGCFEELFEGSQEVRYASRNATVLSTIASIARIDGSSEQAESLYLASLDLYPQEGYQTHRAYVLSKLGSLAESRNDFKAAIEYLEECRELNRQIGRRAKEIEALEALIAAAEEVNDHEAQADYSKARDALIEAIENETHECEGEA